LAAQNAFCTLPAKIAVATSLFLNEDHGFMSASNIAANAAVDVKLSPTIDTLDSAGNHPMTKATSNAAIALALFLRLAL
jgi:hypothetical protein